MTTPHSALRNPQSDTWPAVTCLCPTHGRFERLRDAVACFLLQDYPGRKELHILSDAAVPLIVCPNLSIAADQYLVDAHVRVINVPPRRNLGQKRQALLETASTDLVGHWDDDDLYLPWHLSMLVSRLMERPWRWEMDGSGSAPMPTGTGASCVKPRAGWWGLGPRDALQEVKGPCHNTFEGQMLFEREAALMLDGYPPRHSGQAKVLLDAFHDADELHTWDPADEDISYVYRWSDGVQHVSAKKGLTQDQDFGDGRPLIDGADPVQWARDRLARQFAQLADRLAANRALGPETAGTVRRRLQAALSRTEAPTATPN